MKPLEICAFAVLLFATVPNLVKILLGLIGAIFITHTHMDSSDIAWILGQAIIPLLIISVCFYRYVKTRRQKP